LNEIARGSSAPGYRLLALLTLLNMLNFADRYLLVSFSHSVIADLQLSNLQFALLTGIAFTLFYAVFGLFSGALADRWHRPRLIALGLFLWSALTAVTGVARSFAHVALTRFLIGVGESLLTPAAMSMLSDTLPPNRRSLGAAVYYLGIPLGVGGSFLFAAIAGPALGWRGAFLLLGAIGAVAAVLMLWMADPPRGKLDAAELSPEAQRIGSLAESARGMAGALRTTPVLVLVLVGSAAAIFVQGAAVLDVVWWVKERGYSEPRAQAILGAMFLVGGIVGVLIGGIGAEWFRARRPAGRLQFLAAAYLVAMPIGLAYRFVEPGTVLFYALAFLFNASFMISYGATFPTVQELVPIKLRGASVALLILCNNLLGQALGAATAGLLADVFAARGAAQPLSWAIFIAIVPGLLAVPAFYWAARLQARIANSNPA
jgi:MFS transporter, Spinster family, sphingosine-1-phosphate transporter